MTQADIDNIAGVFNEACVDDGPAGAAPKCSNVTTPPNQNPTLSLTKTARIKVITYSFKITNTGNVTLSTVALSDPMIGTITGCDAQTLAPGAMTTCEADYTVSAKDLINGFVTNVASATAAGGVMKTATVTMTPLTVVSVP